MMCDNGLVVENIKIEKILVGDFYFDVVMARNLYIYLDQKVDFSIWVKHAILNFSATRDYFEIYSESKSSYAFSIEAAKKILNWDGSNSAKNTLHYLSSYDQDIKKHVFENTLLSDHDRYDVVQRFAKQMGCEDQPVAIPAETLIAVVAAIRGCNGRINEMHKMLDNIDMSSINRALS